MQYSLIKIPSSNGKPETIINFENKFHITEICRIDDLGIILVSKDGHCLGLLNNKNELIFPWIGHPGQSGCLKGTGIYAKLHLPSSICYSKKYKKCYIVEDGGARIRSLELSMLYVSSLFGKVDEQKMNMCFSKTKNVDSIDTYCSMETSSGGMDNIYWTVDQLHKCFKYNGDKVTELIGSGKAGYSVSNNTYGCDLNYPSGIVNDENSVYISDTGNHCIRALNKSKTSVIVGSPDKNSTLVSPYCLRLARKVLYFIDNGNVISFSFNNRALKTIYSSQRLISISSGERGDIFILEVKE